MQATIRAQLEVALCVPIRAYRQTNAPLAKSHDLKIISEAQDCNCLLIKFNLKWFKFVRLIYEIVIADIFMYSQRIFTKTISATRAIIIS